MDLDVPKQSTDAATLIKNLTAVLVKDDQGQSYNREFLKGVAYRLSIVLETAGDIVQRIACYVEFSAS